MEQPKVPPDPSPEWIAQAVEAWTREGLVKREQAKWILARYGLAEAETAHSLRQLTFVQIVTALGALLIGVGVLILVGTQWESIPRYARLGLLLVVTAAAYGGGYYLACVRNTYPGVGRALIFLGSLIWGSSIFLVGQMYHLSDSGSVSSEYYTGLAWWFAGTLPLAYVLRSPLQLALSLTLGTIWIVGRWLERADGGPAAAATFLILLAVGGFLYAVGLLHQAESDTDAPLGSTYRKFGVAFVTVSLYVFTFDGLWHSLGNRLYSADIPASGMPWWWLAPLMSLTVLCSGWVLLRRSLGERAPTMEAAICVAGVAGSGLVAALVTSHWSNPLGHNEALALVIAFNLALLGTEIGIIWLGWQTAQPGLVNYGLVVFMVHLMTRYFDLFGEMLYNGLGLIGTGLIVLLCGLVLEKQRRRLLRTMPGRAFA